MICIGFKNQLRRPWSLICLSIGLLLASMATPAKAVMTVNLNLGALVIVDNGPFDTIVTAGAIGFVQTIGNYTVGGTVDMGVGPNQVTLLGTPSANLRLTSFVAEALVNNAGSFTIEFSSDIPGTFTGVLGATSVDPYVGHINGLAVPAGQDSITGWTGYVSGQLITTPFPGPPPYFNPFLPFLSPQLPYTVFGHGPSPVPPGTFTNPVLGGILTFDLGGAGDQLILYSSAEVGISSVPEVGTFVMMGVAITGAGLIGLRRRRQETR